MVAVLRVLLAVVSIAPVIQETVTGSGPPLGCEQAEGHWYLAKWFEDTHHRYDGDTIWIDTYPGGWSHSIRFAGVDTPELDAKDENKEPVEAERARAREAKAFTGDWLNERDGMVLLYVEDAGGKYGRPICWIFDFDGECLNLELVAEGLIKNE
jgi:endonuclease YncB( thermonuclease family)